MLAASYNLPVETRVWDQDASLPAWGPWVLASPAMAVSPGQPAGQTAGQSVVQPAGITSSRIAAGIVALGALSVLAYAAAR